MLTNNSTFAPNESVTPFGEALRNLRREAGITQRDLAAKTGLDFTYVSKLENGRTSPPAADTVVSIARALQVSPDNLLALSGKLSSDVRDAVATNPAAQEFLRVSAGLSLTTDEWKQLGSLARTFRAPAE